MKLPFRFLFGPLLRRYSSATATFCSNGVFMIGDAYVISISIIGFVLGLTRELVKARLRTVFITISAILDDNVKSDVNLTSKPWYNKILRRLFERMRSILRIDWLVSIQDVCRLVSCGDSARGVRRPCALNPSHQPRADLPRDIKLISTALMVPQYLWLGVGAASGNAVLFMPYLVMEFLVIGVEVLDLVWSICLGTMKRVSFPTTVLVFNWLQAFCAFRKWINACDL